MRKDRKLNSTEAADYLQIPVTALEEATYIGRIQHIELEDETICYTVEQLDEYTNKLSVS
ncbi:MAG: hypothetical protein LC778_19855 [Acidobacteria bacterium]|nr:hypothetical protein [Acidobacteriota bacterium]